jgi:hypothetical protein
MKLVKALAAAALLVLLVPVGASAEVQLSLHEGRVTLIANDATIRQILTEWARVGQTKIVNMERIPGGPVTLQLTDVPEPEALDLLLKSVTGYMAAPRAVGVPTLSRYDRILVLPTAAVPRVPVTGTPAPVFEQPNVPQFEPDDIEGPSFPPRGPLFPTLQQPQPGFPVPQGVEDQVNFPQQMIPPPNQPPDAPSSFPGAAAVGTPRPGMVLPPPTPQVAPGIVFPAQPPPDN